MGCQSYEHRQSKFCKNRAVLYCYSTVCTVALFIEFVSGVFIITSTLPVIINITNISN